MVSVTPPTTVSANSGKQAVNCVAVMLARVANMVVRVTMRRERANVGNENFTLSLNEVQKREEQG